MVDPHTALMRVLRSNPEHTSIPAEKTETSSVADATATYDASDQSHRTVFSFIAFSECSG